MYRERMSYPRMPILTPEFLDKLAGYARNGIPRDEVLKGWSIDWFELNETEKVYFDEIYNYGRMDGINKMTEVLWQQARAKGGYPACIAFLQQFSKEWEKHIESGNSDGMFNFSFVKGQPPSAESKSH